MLQQCRLVIKKTKTIHYRGYQPLNKKISDKPNKIIVFFAEVTVRLVKCYQFV
jgi:hypothetical protein